MDRVPLWQCPSSPPAPHTPRESPGHWAPSHRLGCSSQPPPKSPIPPPLTTQVETPDFPHTIVADMDLADSKGDFRWEHLEKQLPPGVTLQRGLRGFTDHPNFLVARAKKVRGS